jgi:hypothetical protein
MQEITIIVAILIAIVVVYVINSGTRGHGKFSH